ncbi:putative amidase [Fonsecaea pedrosoi]|nr:putative amidase [Fonsecaea pedrosoi]
MAENWQDIASKAQAGLLNSIPPKWRLPEPVDPSVMDVRGIPRACGLLTEKQLLITEQTASELVPQLRDGKLSSVEVTEAFCARAAIAHQCVNCLTAFFPDEALARAKELDDILAKTGVPVGPLHGLPVGIKDIFHMKDKNLTMGYLAWHNNRCTYDASIIQMLRNAGAVFFVRTTMPQTGMFLETWSNLWGRTMNPFNRHFSAGGSSGGDGSLVAMRGAPFCPSTDIGGSIRAPGTFNGLYAMRPTADRTAKRGMGTPAPGQISIKVSSGPNCYSMADVKLVAEILLTHHGLPFEPTAVRMPWQQLPAKTEKLCIGLLATDGCVTPQPPIARALEETAANLRAAGHEGGVYIVIEFQPPFDCWEVAQATWRLWFQTGAKETLDLVASSGEPLYPTFKWYLETFNIQPLTVPELFKLNTKQAEWKYQFAAAWHATASRTRSGRPIDCLLCPCAPSASFPHGFPVWWGYFSLWNLLDYPSIVLPLKKMRVDRDKDRKDVGYTPRDNVFDRMNWEVYDPERWANLPVTVQLVRPQFGDEELIAVAEVVDQVCNS